MPTRTIVDDRYDEGATIVARLFADGSISEAQTLQDLLRRAFVVGAASYFEQILKDTLLEFASRKSNADMALISLVKASLIDRGFHQMFQWEAKNANKFFAYFGPDLGDALKKSCGADFKGPMQAFMELGNLRNCIVHQNFHIFYFEKTLDECYASYRAAKEFVDFIIESIAPIESN